MPLQWRHNESDGISNHRRLDCLFKPLFRHRSKKTPKLRVTGLCEGNIPVTGERASNAENISIWSRHHAYIFSLQPLPADHSGKHQGLQLQFSRLSRVGVTASPSSVLVPEFCVRKGITWHPMFHERVQKFICHSIKVWGQRYIKQQIQLEQYAHWFWCLATES